MSFHFLSHSWEVNNIDDGIVVTIRPHEVDANTLGVMVDDLCELVRERDYAKLYVDLGRVAQTASILVAKLVSLDGELRKFDCKLIVSNLDPALHEAFQKAGLTETLDIRIGEPSPIVDVEKRPGNR